MGNTVQNGKGSKWRKTNYKAYWANFDEIFKKPKQNQEKTNENGIIQGENKECSAPSN